MVSFFFGSIVVLFSTCIIVNIKFYDFRPFYVFNFTLIVIRINSQHESNHYKNKNLFTYVFSHIKKSFI